MTWWMWLTGGLVLMLAELLTPSGFFIMFFGLGALTVGVLGGLGLVETGWVAWLLFTLTSLGYVTLFRAKAQRWFQAPPPPDVDLLVGVLAVPQGTIEPGAVGRVEVRGTAWSGRNVGVSVLVPGQRCTVVNVDGLLLDVRPEQP